MTSYNAMIRCFIVPLFAATLFANDSALAQSDPSKVARQLANPISSLISVPFQANYDGGAGPTR